MMRRAFGTAFFASSLIVGLPQSYGAETDDAERTIVLGALDWDGARAIQGVLQVVLEDRLGLHVEVVSAPPPEIVAAMDRGRGEIDVFPDFWMPNHSATWKEYIAKGSRETVLVNKLYLGTQGIYVPGYLQDAHDIRRAEQLADPAVAKLFDTDGNGLGEYWAGPAGWTSTPVEIVKANTYGYAEYFEMLSSEDTDFKKELVAKYQRQEPLLFYYWTPDRIHASLDLRKLEEPPFDGFAMPSKKDDPLYDPDGCWYMLYPEEDEAWKTKSRVSCAYPDSSVYVAYSKSLVERIPAAAHFLQRIELQPETVTGWILLVSEYDMEPTEMARAWIEETQDIVDGWLTK